MKRALLLLPLVLAACSRQPAHETAPARPPLAVAQGVIDAEAGLIRIRTPRDGVVEFTAAEEGDHVAAGQSLATLQSRQARLDLAVVSADLADRRAQLDVARARAADTQREAARLGRLVKIDAATRQDAERAATAATVAAAEARQAAAALDGAQARQDLGAYEVQLRDIQAPMAGRIVRRTTAAGAFVSASTSLFVLEPDGRRVVRAELDESFAALVRPGMAATVTRQYGSGGAYRAHVVRVADLLAGPSLPDEPTAKADARVVSVLLTLDASQDLRLGERVLVRFAP